MESSRRIGLARALSKLGYCSRSRASELIREGRVRLNGKARQDPETAVHLERDRVEVDGAEVAPMTKIYLVMNKPRGLVTTASDEKGRDTVYSILQAADVLPWVAPIGRLDKASEGLLLFTNDSEWGARAADPDMHLQKTYHVQIGAIADEALIRAMEQGVRTAERELLSVTSCRMLRSGEKNCWLEIVLEEGKNRHIRRIFEASGVEVLRLVRVAFGPLQLGTLAKGKYRPLQPEEKNALDRAIGVPAKSSPQRRRGTQKNTETSF